MLIISGLYFIVVDFKAGILAINRLYEITEKEQTFLSKP